MRRVRADKVIVSLVSADGNKELFSRCLPTTTVQELKSKWRQEHGPIREDVLLRTVDGAFPTDDLALNSFNDCSNPCQVIELTVMSGQGVWLSYCRNTRLLPANSISKTPRQLDVRVRELFGFDVNQAFRLRSSNKVLALDRSLMDQGVGPGSQLEVEKKNLIVVKDMWNDGQEFQLQVFESQTLSESFPPSWQESAAEMEILSESGDQRILPNTAVKDLLGQNAQVTLRVDHSEEIPLLLDHQVSRPALSSGDQPRTVLPYRTRPREVIAGQGQNLVPTAMPLGRNRRRGHRGYPFFHVDPLRVMFREGEKKAARFKVLRLARGSLSEDVRQNRLAAGRTAARDEQILDGAGNNVEAKEGPPGALKDGAHVHMKPGAWCHYIRVVTGGRTLEWTEPRPAINFSELTGHVAMLTKTSPLEVLRRAFRCTGCGRRICQEEEEFQMIPASCCRERSLVLREVNEKGTQTRVPRYLDKECGTDDLHIAGGKQKELVIAEQETGSPGIQTLEDIDISVKSYRQTPFEAELRPPSPPRDRGAGVGVFGHSDSPCTLGSMSPTGSLPRRTEPRIYNDDTTVEVYLSLPMEAKDVHEVLKKDVTLSRVIEDIHRDRAFFPVNDIIVNGRQMNTREDWRRMTVAECNIRSGDRVVIEPGRPDSVTVLTMHVDGFHDRENIPLDIHEWSWGVLWSRINFFFATDGKQPVVFVSMTFIDRLGKPQQRGVRGGNLLHGIVANYDEITGLEVNEDGGQVATTFANEFLCPSSGFRAPPKCSPILHIHPNCDVLCLPRPDAPITEVCDATDDALFDVDNAALVWGLRSRQGRSERWQLYLEHGDGSICNVEHGNTFEDASSLPGTGTDVRRAILILRNGDLIPHCRTSPNTPVKVWTRNRLKYSVEGRRIKVQKSDKTFDALWILTRSVGSFQRNFTDIMGRRP